MGNGTCVVSHRVSHRSCGFHVASLPSGSVCGSSFAKRISATVIVFARQAGLMVAVTAVSGLLCAAVALGCVGQAGISMAGAAALISVPTGLAVLLVFRRWGAAPEAILLGTFLRLGLTLATGAMMATAVPVLWGRPFFLSLAAIYLANLSLETWFVYEQNRRSGLSSTASS